MLHSVVLATLDDVAIDWGWGSAWSLPLFYGDPFRIKYTDCSASESLVLAAAGLPSFHMRLWINVNDAL